METKLTGLILNQMAYKDKDKILYLLTKAGKLSILVPRSKSLKGGLANATLNLNLIEFSYKGTNLLKATYLEASDYYFEIKNDLKKMAIASYALELLYKFVSSDTYPEVLYNLVISFLNELRAREDYKMILLEFKIKMLYFLGIEPNFKRCFICGSKDNLVGLNLISGSVSCVNHETKDNISNTATKIIERIYHDKTFKMTIEDEEVLNYLLEIIDKYYEIHFKEKLKSETMLKELKLC